MDRLTIEFGILRTDNAMAIHLEIGREFLFIELISEEEKVTKVVKEFFIEKI